MDMVAQKTTFQKYPAYKESGVEWLGKIPKEWEVKKLKFVGNIYAGINGKKGDDFSKEYKKGLKPFIPFTNICNNSKIDEIQYQFVKIDEKENQNRVKANDILFLMSSETLDDIAKCSIYLGMNEELYLNSFCKGFRISNPDINPKYINYLFSSKIYRNYFALVGRGFTRINLKQEFINDALITIPTLSEQTAIANFLDDKTAKIDRAITQKERMIELLKERKQIIIQNAVTKGLDPNAKMKHSGVEWIGEIPEHWEVKKFRYVFNLGKGLTITKENLQDEGIACVNYGEIHSKYGFEVNPEIHELKCVDIEYLKSSPNALLKQGDFVFADTSEDIEGSGNFTYLNSKQKTFAGYHTVIARPKRIVNSRFLAYSFDSLSFRNQIRNKVKGVKVYSITQSILSEPVVWLPTIKEQEEIVAFLDNKCIMYDQSINLNVRQINKLKEYKATLIDSAVTGKIKVC
ncbi:restriction endonuclease subunit S [Sungkyunkwania multivorans]|uniref:Restriction endonuclease subunit S n=1 Tax=Sungkyunkwania multivorans TaxID=1173618 RepID=A0ABW3D1X3_9FLAO